MTSITDILPSELLVNIMILLPIKSVFRFCQCKKELYETVQDEYFWKLKLEHEYPNYPIPSFNGNKTYRDLYRYRYGQKVGSCKLYEISENIFNPEEFGINPREITVSQHKQIPELLSKSFKVQEFIKQLGIRRGDVIHLSTFYDYRNEGKLIYTGSHFVDLDYSREEYGCVPIEFQVIEEFPIHYWTEHIEHNFIVNFDLRPYIEEASKNLQPYDIDYATRNEQPYIDEEDYIYITTFTHWSGDKYTIIIARDEPTSLEEAKELLKTRTFSANDEYEIYQEPFDRETTLFFSPFSLGAEF